MTRVTKTMLRGACKEQKTIFLAEWPNGCEATIENVRRAQALGLDLDWGIRWFTPEARATYEAAVAPARLAAFIASQGVKK